MTSVNNNNSGPNCDPHKKKHSNNTGWIIGGSIAGGLAVTGIGYGVYRHMNRPEPPSMLDSFVKNVIPHAQGLAKPALGVGAALGALMMLKKAASRDLEQGEDSLLRKASDWLTGHIGGGHQEYEGHPDEYYY